jgi:cytochrome c biogenesis protein CcmG/thiol:disulfide interchange protein DsbE
MSTRSSTSAPRASKSSASTPPARKTHVWLWVAIAAVIALALGIALWSTSGSDTTVEQGTTATDNASSSAAETQPVTVVGTALPVAPEGGADSAIGLTAPTLQGFHFDGSPIDITPGGRAMMVVFLAHWCPHCNNEIPVLQSWAAAGGLPANLDIIGVSTAASAQRDNYPPSKWIVDKQWAWPVMADSNNSDAANAYGVAGFPTFVIVGADGKVKVRSSGELPIADLEALVKQALAT